MSLEHFTFGYRELREGTLIRLEPFCTPHDDHMLDHVRTLMPNLVADFAEGACIIRICLNTGEISVVGSVRNTDVRDQVHCVAQEGAFKLRIVNETLETLRKGLSESTPEILKDLGLAERMELVKGLWDPKRKRAITLPDHVPFYTYAKARTEETMDSILAAAFSNSPDFPRA